MKAGNVMTPTVVTVRPSQTITDIARLMLGHRISAVPITDEFGRVLGIVSEGDLVRRAEIGTTKRHSSRLDLIANPDARAAEYTKTHAATARDVMTKPAITVSLNTSLGQVAEVLEKNHIKRVPVVDKERLVGIISRANIVQALAAAKHFEIRLAASDHQVRERLLESLQKEQWASIGATNVTVHDGTIT
jgi:CBS-domain-containing membrane protein